MDLILSSAVYVNTDTTHTRASDPCSLRPIVIPQFNKKSHSRSKRELASRTISGTRNLPRPILGVLERSTKTSLLWQQAFTGSRFSTLAGRCNTLREQACCRLVYPFKHPPSMLGDVSTTTRSTSKEIKVYAQTKQLTAPRRITPARVRKLPIPTYDPEIRPAPRASRQLGHGDVWACDRPHLPSLTFLD